MTVADSQPQKTDAATTVPEVQGGLMRLVMRLIRFLSALRAWAGGHWIRSLIIAVTMLSLIGLTIGGWAYLASVAIHTGELDVNGAIKAFDEGRYEEARTAVGRMLTNGRLPKTEFGGPLFVLGAIKTKDAQDQANAERRRVEYLIASRYLTEARAYGIPVNREAQGIFLLGKSLIESGQFEEGIRVLKAVSTGEASQDPVTSIDTERLLAETCLVMPSPQLDEALKHNKALLANPKLSPEQRSDALLQQAECLCRLGRFDESRKAMAAIPTTGSSALVALMTGRLLLDEIESALQKLPASDRAKAMPQFADKVNAALENVQKARKLDEQKKQLANQWNYELARGLELKGDAAGAIKQYAHTRQMFGDSYEALAASLAEADLLRQKGEYDAALLGYRRVLEGYAAIPLYRSHVLPVAQVRDRLMAAITDLQHRQRFRDVLSLIDKCSPLFSRPEQLELRGATFEQWGNSLLSKPSDDSRGPHSDRTAGLQRYRAAGVAFEELAQYQFATKQYTSDLWRGAEDFIHGQSFSHAIRLLNEYLKYEPQLRNAEALLRLGQAHLALGEVPQSIAAFDECIEFHPIDGATYQARIDCAKAYWQQGDTARAEQLLRYNIAGSSLKPASPEWKDSLFELGMLLHEAGKYEEAIGTLEDAVERYPGDPQELLAQYMIGESYRRWAQDFLKDAQSTTTASERDKILTEANKRLNTALTHFADVQRDITLRTHDIHGDALMGSMLRNCYMLEGAVLFDLARYKEAIEAYSNVSSLYPDEPFVLETFVQIANCWRRLDKNDNARGAIQQAQIALERFPRDSDFASTTSLNRDEWGTLLASMSKW